ncbi:MAG TPA: hypothetical protein VEJ87_00520, partial [Acidimicrobiales bacterium]|nr:hypothetical protein [Acidimicrobiales bacterium]
GSWVTNDPLPRARVFYDVQSRQHAWHSELWDRRLPHSHSFDPGELAIPPSLGVDQMLNLVAGGEGSGSGSGGSGGTLLRLVGIARVLLPRLVAGYTIHLRRVVPIADAPTERALRLILNDEIEAWHDAELYLQELVRRPSDVAAVTAHQQALEGLVAEEGPGLVGLGAMPVEPPFVAD